VTYGSFNNISKITPQVVAAWAGVLQGTPGSRLVIKGQLLARDAARIALSEAFVAEGLDAGRVELRAWVPRADNPLAAYHEIDIALDTFPYNGTTTTFEALWMGVPVVTLRGERHAARVGASILSHLGRREWIAPDLTAFRQIAVGLAADRPALAGYRRALRGELARSSLTDSTGFARKLEAVYRDLLRATASGPASQPDKA
jgi:predicted O-linked N-acetylglucosamine transferase (SPINDLY family)